MSWERKPRQRLDAADDLCIWYGALREVAERARLAGDRGTEMLANDAGEALLALADRLVFVERAVPARETRD